MVESQQVLTKDNEILDPEYDVCIYRPGGIKPNNDYENMMALYYHPTSERDGIFYFISKYGSGRMFETSSRQAFLFMNYLKGKGIDFNQIRKDLL